MADEIVYRQASDEDTERINAFYNAVYKKNRTKAQFDWEFNSSPAGKAIYIIAECKGEVVGTQCAIPYYIITQQGSEVLSAKSEDTLVSKDFRGRNIFENMYRLLIEECRKEAIVFLWGFTYADKPFRKTGFSIPYKSSMGILSLKPKKAADYFFRITSEKSRLGYMKILALTFFSYLNKSIATKGRGRNIELSFEIRPLNSDRFNYLEYRNSFGLKLDKAFMDYRLNSNPYSHNYKCASWTDKEILKASVHYNITPDNIGYIIHLYADPALDAGDGSAFLWKVIRETALKDCVAIRFWGFKHNPQNLKEVALLKKAGFLFLDRGISFVGLDLNKAVQTDFGNFVLSRMASQGTD